MNIWEDISEVKYEDEGHKLLSYATFNQLVKFLTSSEDLSKYIPFSLPLPLSTDLFIYPLIFVFISDYIRPRFFACLPDEL